MLIMHKQDHAAHMRAHTHELRVRVVHGGVAKADVYRLASCMCSMQAQTHGYASKDPCMISARNMCAPLASLQVFDVNRDHDERTLHGSRSSHVMAK
jgi:hypothetical protein